MPMHMKNEDRHGIKNMEKEQVKMLDRARIPAPLIFVALIVFLGMIALNRETDGFEKISKKALMNSMKKYGDKMEYTEKEITPAEQSIMESSEYKLQQSKKKVADHALKNVKNHMRAVNMQVPQQEVIRLADKR